MSIELRQAAQQALKALEAISDEMTVGERYTNAGQYLLDALGPLRAALSQHPAQATQTAEVTDEQILEIAEPFGEFQYGDAQGHKRIDFARAILSPRPERVPMTGDQWTDVLGSAGPDLLDLAKQWADNKVHVYQVVNEAEFQSTRP